MQTVVIHCCSKDWCQYFKNVFERHLVCSKKLHFFNHKNIKISKIVKYCYNLFSVWIYAQNHSPEHSLSPFLAGGMIFPSPSGMLDPCQFSSNNWKLISFNSTWLHNKKNKKKRILSLFQNLHLSLSLSLLPLLVCTYLNNAWDLVLLELPLYVCLFKINRFMYSPIVSRFG